MSIIGQGTLIAGRGRERYQNVWIVLFKFTYILSVSSLVPAQMMTLIGKLIMGKPLQGET